MVVFPIIVLYSSYSQCLRMSVSYSKPKQINLRSELTKSILKMKMDKVVQ